MIYMRTYDIYIYIYIRLITIKIMYIIQVRVQILYYIHDRYPPLSVSLLFIFSSLTPGVITQIPQMTTDLQRSTRFGDVNCQAFQP